MLSVDVVVVEYNSRQHLRACVEPLVGVPGVSIFVVDDADVEPSEASRSWRSSPGVRVIHMPRNGGFAYGRVRQAAGGRSHGTRPFPQPGRAAGGRRARPTGSHAPDRPRRPGVIGPRTLSARGRDTHTGRFVRIFPHCVRRTVRPSSLPSGSSGVMGGRGGPAAPARYERPGRVDWLPGACLLVRRSTLEAVGRFRRGILPLRRGRRLLLAS